MGYRQAITVKSNSVQGLPGHLSVGGTVIEGPKDAIGRYAQTGVTEWHVVTLLANILKDEASVARLVETVERNYGTKTWVSVENKDVATTLRAIVGLITGQPVGQDA